MIFALGPYIVNNLHKTLTAGFFNVIPNGIILALFISESEFHHYFRACVVCPLFNVLCNLFVYLLYINGYIDSFSSIILILSIWVSLTIISFYIPQEMLDKLFV